MAETYMKNHPGSQYTAYTFGSPGSLTTGNDSRMTQFLHPNDGIGNASLWGNDNMRTEQVFLYGENKWLQPEHSISRYAQNWLSLYSPWHDTRIQDYRAAGKTNNYFVGDSSDNRFIGTGKDDVFFYFADDDSGSDSIFDEFGGNDTLEIRGIPSLDDIYFERSPTNKLEISFKNTEEKLTIDGASWGTVIVENLRLFSWDGDQTFALNMATIISDYSELIKEKVSLQTLIGGNLAAYTIS